MTTLVYGTLHWSQGDTHRPYCLGKPCSAVKYSDWELDLHRDLLRVTPRVGNGGKPAIAPHTPWLTLFLVKWTVVMCVHPSFSCLRVTFNHFHWGWSLPTALIANLVFPQKTLWWVSGNCGVSLALDLTTHSHHLSFPLQQPLAHRSLSQVKL